MSRHANPMEQDLIEPWIDIEAVRLMEKLEPQKAPRPPKPPAQLPLKDIKAFPELFQPRDAMMDERHIGDLVKVLQSKSTKGRPGNLDAILVVETRRGFAIVDGHHRLEAYRRAGRKFIPITVFSGTVKEAVLKAGTENSMSKRIMTTKERQDYAWRLTRAGCFSKNAIAEAASVGTSQVAAMRRLAKQLGEKAQLADHWWQAWHIAKASGLVERRDNEDMDEAKASAIAEKLSKSFGTKLLGQPAIAARALQLYFGNTLQSVLEELREPEGEPERDAVPVHL